MIPSVSDIRKKADPGFRIGRDTVSVGRTLESDIVYADFLDSYSVYYNVTRLDMERDSSGAGIDSPWDEELRAAGFAARAVFDSKGEQYFLIKAAKVAEVNSAEYVYFARIDRLDADTLRGLDTKAWEDGTAHVKPSPSHKNTDVVLIIIADEIDDECKALIKSLKHSRNYMFALHGYSNYRLVAVGTKEGTAYFNKQAGILRTLVGNILIKDEKERGK